MGQLIKSTIGDRIGGCQTIGNGDSGNGGGDGNDIGDRSINGASYSIGDDDGLACTDGSDPRGAPQCG
jgi:hypothetical protein